MRSIVAASSSDSEGPVGTTPPRRRLQPRGSSPINERKAARKRRRTRASGLAVIEGSKPTTNFDDSAVEPSAPNDDSHGGGQADTKQPPKDPTAAFAEALNRLPAGFAEDYFLGHGCAKLDRALVVNAGSPAGHAKAVVDVEAKSDAERFVFWHRIVQIRFSLLLHGVGSKRRLMKEFAEQVLKPAQFVLVHMHAFDARFSFCECLRGLLEQVYPDSPRLGTSAEALGATVRAAAASGSRPLCFLVHNLESLPHAHTVILSSLAASPGVHLVASVDNIWAPLAWDARCLKDFNFCREEVNTFEGYEMESFARYPGGLPPWSGLGHDKRRAPKASLGLVLRSLTNNHRELVQAMAERQLESGCRAGISLSALLKISTDRMIAASVPKLRSLLNELRDHEVVVQRGSSVVTAQVLFYLPFDDLTLQRLKDGRDLESDDEGEGAPCGVNVGEEEEEELVA